MFASFQALVQHHTHYTNKELTWTKENVGRTANELVAHHAALIRSVRAGYVEDMRLSKSCRDDAASFELNTEKYCQDLQGMMEECRRHLVALQAEVFRDQDGMRRRQSEEARMRETGTLELKEELENFERRLNAGEDIGDVVMQLCKVGPQWGPVQVHSALLDRKVALRLQHDLVEKAMSEYSKPMLMPKPTTATQKWRRSVKGARAPPAPASGFDVTTLIGGATAAAADLDTVPTTPRPVRLLVQPCARGSDTPQSCVAPSTTMKASVPTATAAPTGKDEAGDGAGGVGGGRGVGDGSERRASQVEAQLARQAQLARRAQRPGSHGQPHAIGSRGTMRGTLADDLGNTRCATRGSSAEEKGGTVRLPLLAVHSGVAAVASELR
eukprot:NODE_5902_length_1724_cov_3.640576.p1 GENE.NODE_5902_length_1724_cov_3.640576~~NODE_5902_length_1724_cov_3.640576.p1  ORF type:complete len:400 (+),score=133.75 NODE_5902_length_1724_cov_3.640576:51-1202(+)